ncbi:uncharacterized protein LOC110666990 isoform X2 [Hevea brasiliensis]|nr:uncharacterized protein LOC110666990 isoform X2 [Hevea brasiliensis]
MYHISRIAASVFVARKSTLDISRSFQLFMASLGFRPPQFSEDLAWLPPWLQNLQVESSDTNHLKEPQTIISQLQTFSREEGRYNSCHLFLSGEDTSQNSASLSPGNALHLRLHLSSYGESIHSQTQDLCASQALHGSSKVLLLPQVEASGGSQQKACQSKVVDGVKISNLTSVPIAVEKVCPESPTNNEEFARHYEEEVYHNAGAVITKSDSPIMENAGHSSRAKCMDSRQHEEKFNVRHINDADVSDAVELSIAASEALAIHELMITGSTLEFLPTGTILEAALQVKQARLEALEDGICSSSEEIDEIDFLSDLDDLIMENAFLDVGLSLNNPDGQHACGSDASQVKDTPVLENHYRHNNESNIVQLMSQQDKVSDGSALGLEFSNVASLVDPILHQPAEKISHVSAMAQPSDDISSSPACISENAEGRECYLVADRFRSRWLGGWTVKEADASAKLKQNNTKGMLNFFDGETSFLSESADVAADENSFVRKLEAGSKIASPSSIPFEGVLEKADEGILISQEVGSCNQSLVDPLCSVVPCSISSENASSPSARNQDNRKNDAQNCFSTESGHKMENFQRQRMSALNVESVYVDKEVMPIITGDCSEAPVRRQLASLRTYSTLSPKHDTILKGQRLYQNQQLSSEHVELLLSNQFDHCHNSDDQKSFKCFLPPRSEFECTVGRDHEQNQDTIVIRSPVSDHDEPAKDGAELQLQPSVPRRSPLILNRRTRCHLQPSEFLDKKLSGKRSPEQISAQGTGRKPIHSCQKIKSKLQNPPNAPNLVRKRVCFSEFEIELQQDKDVQKPKSSHRNCFAVRANKRSKYSKLRSDSWTQDVKSCFRSHINDVKILIFHGLEFLLTGFSSRKEREIVRLIQEYGGMVLLDVPSPPLNSGAKRRTKSNFQKLPIVICSKKLQTTKFLYGCAVNAPILKVKWLADSIAAGSLELPEKYMVLPNQAGSQYKKIGKSDYLDDSSRIFHRVGIMLHGKHSFCTKLATIIKHGGGQVFKTLQRLFLSLEAEKISVGAIVAEDECRASRHLKHCALERKIPMMPASWIAKSLHFGKLLPFKERDDTPTIKAPKSSASFDWSEEI